MKTPRYAARERREEGESGKVRVRADSMVKNEDKVGERGVTLEMERKKNACVQINVDVFKRVEGRVGSFGLFSLAHLPGEAAMNRKV